MRITRKNRELSDEIESKKQISRSSSSFQGNIKPSLTKLTITDRDTLTPTLGERKIYDSSEKTNTDDTLNLNSIGICKYCLVPKDLEAKILHILEDISYSMNSTITTYNSWKNSQIHKFVAKLKFKDLFPNDTEISVKTLEINNLNKAINDIIFELTQDIEKLSRTSAWKNASVRKPAQNNITISIQETFAQAQKHLAWLKTNTSLKLHENSDNDLTRCLQLELQQSIRERRLLEAKVLTTGNSSPDNIVKILERVIQEHQVDLKT